MADNMSRRIDSITQHQHKRNHGPLGTVNDGYREK